MTEEQGRFIIAVLVIIGFFILTTAVLIGFVDVASAEIAKLVGLIFGYAAALMNPIIMRYFKVGGYHEL